MSSEELMNVKGGALNLSAALLQAGVSIATRLFELGRSFGSSIRQFFENKYCQVK